ncbi:hypothetical protein FA13DRAFT_1716126 [Coprinellus micaceus]|uniref:Uncharacterized protein n=1 Tax=Coprinellus micaceus TaxID=71717 RepID=A0A4Y7SME3_COPMI|nr:hypothetical protein FA13DRAFT_1716126 [Coprinellus micaceus]
MPSIKAPEDVLRGSGGHGESQHISHSKVVVQAQANDRSGHFHTLVMPIWDCRSGVAGRPLAPTVLGSDSQEALAASHEPSNEAAAVLAAYLEIGRLKQKSFMNRVFVDLRQTWKPIETLLWAPDSGEDGKYPGSGVVVRQRKESPYFARFGYGQISLPQVHRRSTRQLCAGLEFGRKRKGPQILAMAVVRRVAHSLGASAYESRTASKPVAHRPNQWFTDVFGIGRPGDIIIGLCRELLEQRQIRTFTSLWRIRTPSPYGPDLRLTDNWTKRSVPAMPANVRASKSPNTCLVILNCGYPEIEWTNVRGCWGEETCRSLLEKRGGPSPRSPPLLSAHSTFVILRRSRVVNMLAWPWKEPSTGKPNPSRRLGDVEREQVPEQ